jgi:hypothetical protein
MIVGTAGHIDHGKTTLVKALTGVDCRPPEGREGARHHHRPRLRLCRRPGASASSTCPATSGWCTTCWPAPPASTIRAAGGGGRRRADAADARAPGHRRPARPEARRRGADQGRCRRARAACGGARRDRRAAGRHRAGRRAAVRRLRHARRGRRSAASPPAGRSRPARRALRRRGRLPPRHRPLLHPAGRRPGGDRHRLLRRRSPSATRSSSRRRA